ncbi:MAG: helix-turn-helix domain-containing protein [Chloroflexi bacterium]|nr:helix-turn-helix domain-containing protein [Chloroflexota bacterium]
MANEPETLLEQWIREYNNDPEFVAEGLATDTIQQVIDKLGNRTQSWLADALKVQRQQVSRMLNAPPNLTLTSIARLAIALGTKPRILFDSDAYVIRSLREPYFLEDIDTELTMKKAGLWDTQQTINPVQTAEKWGVLSAA